MALGIFDCIFPKYICFNAYGVILGCGWVGEQSLGIVLVFGLYFLETRLSRGCSVNSLWFWRNSWLWLGLLTHEDFLNPCVAGQFFGVLFLR